MIPLILLMADVSPSSVSPKSAVFACSFLANPNADPDRHVVDLRAERQSDVTGERWLLSWPDGRAARAEAFDAQFGSIGGSKEIRWLDNQGKQKRAFISYGDVRLADGQEAMFLSLDKPSLWQPPGFVCSTAALKENRQ